MSVEVITGNHAAGYALAAAGEDDATNEIYDAIRTRMNDYMYPGMQYLDGLPTESYGYWSQYDFTGAAWTVLAARSAGGSDIVGVDVDRVPANLVGGEGDGIGLGHQVDPAHVDDRCVLAHLRARRARWAERQ